MMSATAFGINGYKDSTYVDLCEGDSYTLEMSGQVITTKGLYFDTLVTPEDEDSIRCYFVNVHPIVHSTENKELLIGSSLEWQGYTIDRAGEYKRTLHSIYGCDSIATLIVIYTYPNPTHYSKETASICEGESYEWQGTVYTETGIYYKKFEAIDHQDSVCVLELTVTPKYFFNETLTFCTFPQVYRGQSMDGPGTYTITYKTITGCDSVYQVVANQADKYHFEEEKTIKEGESITWHNQTISAEGDYYDNLHSIHGCDSIYTLHVTVQPDPNKTTLIEEHIKICEGEKYIWRGKEYSTPATYQDIVKQFIDPTKDSIIYRLYLDVVQPIRVERYASLCLNDTFWIGTTPITQSGTFRDTLRAESTGCDSIVTWVINTNESYLTKSVIVWDADQLPYHWMGSEYSASGIYKKQFKTIDGCDSIYQLELTIRPIYRFDTTVYICPNQLPYEWQGKSYATAGTYTPFQGKSILGADSTYTIHIHVGSTSLTPINATICTNENYFFHGQQLTSPGIYYDTLINIAGCDSVVMLTLNITKPDTITEYINLVYGESYDWQGETYTLEGTYLKSFKDINGCDSVRKLVLTVNNTYLFDTTATTCAKDVPFIWHGIEATQSGTYSKNYKTVQGYDSTYVIHLTVYPEYFFNDILYFCSFPQVYRGQKIEGPGTYEFSYPSEFGCDSIYQIVVNQAEAYHFADTMTIKEGESIAWHNQSISVAGDYFDNLHTIYGCDSTYMLHVIVQPNPDKTTLIEEHIKICEGEKYTWRGQDYTTPDIYQDIVKQQIDPTKDSIVYRLYLDVAQPIRVERFASICLNDTLWISGTPISKPGTFVDTLRAESTGCDSIVTWVINAHQNYLTKSIIQWDSDQLPYQWRGDDYFTTGIYEKQIKTINGCDSIFRLELTIRPVYRFDTTVYVCPSQLPYKWHGGSYSMEGTYTPFKGKTILGADSTYTIHLHVKEPSLTNISASICANEQYVFNGKALNIPGVYYDTLLNIAGCDSVLMLTLNVYNTDTIIEHINIAKGQSYQWQGDTYTEAGVYSKTYKSIFDCDSVRTLILNVHETYLFDTTATVCASQLPFLWHGIEGTQTDTYRKNYLTQQGYDSTYVLHLTVLPTPIYRFNETICKSQTYTFGGKLLNETGVYTHTFKTNGCDSIVELSLNVLDIDTTYEVHQVEEGHTYWLNGKEYVAPGVYDSTFTSRFGCDSIRRLILTVHQVDTIDTTVVICAHERPFIWHGIEGRQTNTYTNVEETPLGNHIVYQLQLTVREAVLTHILDSTCAGTSYQFGKQYLTKTGVYYDTLTTHLGCDSIVELALNVFGTDTIEETRHIKVGDSLEWRGTIYKEPGVYTIQDKNDNGCLKVYRLNLYVHPTYTIEETQTICSEKLPYRWHNTKVYSTGTYYKTYSTMDGYDSTYVLHLTVLPALPISHVSATICSGENFYFGEQNLTKTGAYRHTYYSMDGCDSIVELSLNVLDADTIRETRQIMLGDSLIWKDSVYKEPGIYYHRGTNAFNCAHVDELTLRVYPNFKHTDSVTVCANELPYMWHGQGYLDEGLYYQSFKTVHGYDSTYTLILHVKPAIEVPVYLTICDQQSVTYNDIVYSSKGTYYDRRGCDTTYKVIVTQLPVETYTTHATFDGITPYVWSFNNKSYTQPGIYDEKFTSVITGCDSIYRLDLRKESNFYSEEFASICEGDAFEWRGHQLSHSEIGDTLVFYDSLKTVAGLDSVYKLTLIIHPTVHSFKTIPFCQQITFRGKTYSQSTVVRDTLVSMQYGCDSIVSYYLNLQESLIFRDTVTITNGEVLTWKDQIINKEGTYYAKYQTVYGCDSIYVLAVGVLPAPPQKFVHTTHAIICENDSFVWRNNVYRAAGIYYDSVRVNDPHEKPDSIYVLNLEMRQIYRFTQHLYACGEGSVTYNGKQYDKTGIYTDTLKTMIGCDSIATLHVHINTSFFNSDTLRTHNRDTVLWHGQKIYQSGTYTDRHPSPTGCDSVWQLVAEIYPTYLFEQDTAVCQCETPFNWRGRMIGELGFHTYDTAYKTINGYDSIFRINVTVYPQYEFEQQLNYCEGGSVTFLEKEYNQPGVDTIKLKTVHNCDSFIIVHVNKLPKYHSSEVQTILDGDTIFWHHDTITEPGTYYDKGYTIAGCDSTYEIIVNRIRIDSTIAVICQLDTPYVWRGHNYYVSTERIEVEKDSLGNDSAIFKLHLTINQNFVTHEHYTFCEGESFPFNGKLYINMGADSVALDTIHLTATNHCDSMVVVRISETPKIEIVDTKILHIGDSIIWDEDTIKTPGTYTHQYEQIENGCDSIVKLRVILEQADTVLNKCLIDMPYQWVPRVEDTILVYDNAEYLTDTVRDDNGYITAFHSLHLEVKHPVDTTIFRRGCQNKGVTFNDVTYMTDTVVDVLVQCDTIFRLHVEIDTVYEIHYADTIWEQQLPYILGRQEPDTIWREGTFSHRDTTACGCDSIVNVTLFIIPDLRKNDSIIICERDLAEHPVILGNLADPNRPISQLYPDWEDYKYLGDTLNEPNFASIYPDWREWSGPYGPWKGVDYHEDTIVWNGDSTYFFHLIVKPQPIRDSIYYLCEGDSIRFGYNWEDGSERWIKTGGIYWDSIASSTAWFDVKHDNRIYDTDTILCDSLIRLTVTVLPSYHQEITTHIPFAFLSIFLLRTFVYRYTSPLLAMFIFASVT